MSNEINDLNPGIAKLVSHLRKHGFATTDSGDGQTKLWECDPGIPYVHILTTPLAMVQHSADLVKTVQSLGVVLGSVNEDNSAPTIEVHYNPVDGRASMALWNVTDKDCTF